MADNLQTVYSPAGEKFELSPANARDVKAHAGFTTSKPHPDDVAAYLAKRDGKPAPEPVEPEVETVEDETTDETDTADQSDDNSDQSDDDNADDQSDDENSDEQSDEDNADQSDEEVTEETVEEVTEETVEAKTAPHHFADMDRDAVRTYIEATFPEAVIDGRKNRDGLVAFALELARNSAA